MGDMVKERRVVVNSVLSNIYVLRWNPRRSLLILFVASKLQWFPGGCDTTLP